jgi:thiol-disulfide isomerase/thioredoxin
MIMNGKNVGFLFVPWPALPQSLDVQMPVASCDATAAKVLKAVLGDDISSPHVAVIDAKGTKVIKDDCVRELYNFGAAAYPYTRDAVAKAEAAMKAEKSEKTKGSVQGLAMFTKAGVNELVKADGSTVKVEDVAKKQKVGLYFSAHWCGPCRNFTPKLAQHYKEKLGTVVDEVIFISSDRDDKSFGEYHATMPWCALPFSQRDLKNQISALFDVEGIPTLTIVNPVTGEVLEEDATSSI